MSISLKYFTLEKVLNRALHYVSYFWPRRSAGRWHMAGKAAFYSAPARNGGSVRGAAVAFGAHRGGSATGHRRGRGVAPPRWWCPWPCPTGPRPGSLRRRAGGGL
ncbi:hypothetical protein ACQJBY_055747 [Aegilops geniculata]